MPLDNAAIAELLAIESKNYPMPRSKAYRRASRRAFTWPVEASALLEAGEPMTQLVSVGPYLARVIAELIERGVGPPPVPPERADFVTLASARRAVAGARPLRGDLQMHTTWSDGGSSLEEMALAAGERGYDYIAITDHSAAGLRIVKGLDDARLIRQGREIATLNDRLDGLRVLRSVEMNLTPTGDGDVDPAVLAGLDIVLGSFHSQLRKTEDQTERYLAAIANPHVHVLAHPRGRIYNFRLGLPADWPRVFAAAQAADKAVEIDAYPDRQDLNVELLQMARDAGVRISIGTDAHHHPQLEWIDLGLAAALRAGIPRERIVNYMPLDELLEWIEKVRERAA